MHPHGGECNTSINNSTSFSVKLSVHRYTVFHWYSNYHLPIIPQLLGLNIEME